MRRAWIVAILFIVISLILSACASPASLPTMPQSPTQTQQAPTSPPKTTPAPTQTPTTTPTPAIPIDVRLDYFGVKSTHQPQGYYVARNKVQFFAVVDDGKSKQIFSYPSTNDGIPMDDFYLKDMGEQMLFHTSSISDYLKISLLAYSCEDREAIIAIGKALGVFEPAMSTLMDFYQKMPQRKELIGYYEHIWYPVERWGIEKGQYPIQANDLLVGFRIYSVNAPAPISKPTILPDVNITNLQLPTEAKVSAGFMTTSYDHKFRIVNNETMNISINWDAYSSIKGNFASESVLVPSRGYYDVKKQYWYDKVGSVEITFSIYYKGNKLDSKSGTVKVIP
jgi:hypothetical protein